jgi:3-oxoacyl-[acyl-carrier protein] reductase
MKERGYGRIVNIASNAAIGTALPGTTFYAATKAEVLILTRRFAMELRRQGITVNVVAPGWIVTEMAQAGRSEQEFQVRVRNMSERTMVGRGAAGRYCQCGGFPGIAGVGVRDSAGPHC